MNSILVGEAQVLFPLCHQHISTQYLVTLLLHHCAHYLIDSSPQIHRIVSHYPHCR